MFQRIRPFPLRLFNLFPPTPNPNDKSEILDQTLLSTFQPGNKVPHLLKGLRPLKAKPGLITVVRLPLLAVETRETGRCRMVKDQPKTVAAAAQNAASLEVKKEAPGEDGMSHRKLSFEPLTNATLLWSMQ